MNHYLQSNRQFTMTSLDQTQFLRRIRTALGQAPDVRREANHLFPTAPSPEDLQLLDRMLQRTAADRQAL
jgi:hypothetical protein